MPTYEYKCKNCDYDFEQFQSIKDDVLKTCPECNKDELKRLIGSGAGIIFKGSGFYETDYKIKKGTKPKEEQIKDKTKENKDNSTNKNQSTKK